jgi:hypothetical protein
MTLFVVTFIIVAIAVLGMAVGVIAGHKPIAGSCGGLSKVGLECDGGCEKPCPKRLARMQAQADLEQETKE